MGRPRTLDRKAIHLLLDDGLTQTHVARILGVSQPQVSVIRRAREADAAAERAKAAEAAYVLDATQRFIDGLAQHRAESVHRAVNTNAAKGDHPGGAVARSGDATPVPTTT